MFEQIYQVRGAIEGLAAQLACMNGTELSALDQACDRMSQAADKGDMRSVLQHDFDFHAALLTASGNRLLDEIGLKLGATARPRTGRMNPLLFAGARLPPRPFCAGSSIERRR